MLNSTNHDGSHSESSEVLYQLAYCSVLKQQMDAGALQNLVEVAQRNNIKNDITGMLLIEQGLVVQWLEGKEATVRRLWAKLQTDSRHHCLVELLHRSFIKERLFPDWAMHRTTREEMLTIIHGAREQAENSESSPWAGAIATMCLLIDPEYAKNYGAALQGQSTSMTVLETATHTGRAS
jgi:Sensors of blue-light using FAD